MRFNTHSALEGEHAFLSASNYHWTNYTEEKFDQVYGNHMETLRGTQLHEFAAQAIRLKIKLPRNKTTLNMYVNDAIGYRMQPEQVLFYSFNCFGTADAISWDDKILRIHDLKTGKVKANMRQLEIYMALFCLEYEHDPSKVPAELRIYQSDDVRVHIPEVETIEHLMFKIEEFDKRIEYLRGVAR